MQPITPPSQLKIKEEEIMGLKRQLAQLQGIRLRTEANLASQEALILALQLRQEAEREAKYRCSTGRGGTRAAQYSAV